MLTMMAAYAIATLKSAHIKKYIVSCTVITAVLISVNAYLPFMKNHSTINLMLAGEYLDSIEAGDTVVIALPQSESTINSSVAIPILDLFTNKHIVYFNSSDKNTPQNITDLPWRWTWEFHSTRYLTIQDNITSKTETVVVIQSSHSQQIPPYIERKLEDYHLLKVFNNSSGIFKYKTLVRIYQHI